MLKVCWACEDDDEISLLYGGQAYTVVVEVTVETSSGAVYEARRSKTGDGYTLPEIMRAAIGELEKAIQGIGVTWLSVSDAGSRIADGSTAKIKIINVDDAGRHRGTVLEWSDEIAGYAWDK